MCEAFIRNSTRVGKWRRLPQENIDAALCHRR